MARRLCKAASSWNANDCPAVYLEGDQRWMIAQGAALDASALASLQDLADDESAVRIPTETVLRAVGRFLAEQGRPEVLVEVEAYLAASDVSAGAVR